MRRWLLVLLLLLAVPAWAASVQEDPLQRQAHDIAKQLRCAVCQNESVADSDADLARDMRALILQQLKEGKTPPEIIHYFVQRYGDFILLKPPMDRAGSVVWLLPLVLLLILAASGGIYLFNRLRRPLPPPPKLSEEDRARIQAAREQD